MWEWVGHVDVGVELDAVVEVCLCFWCLLTLNSSILQNKKERVGRITV